MTDQNILETFSSLECYFYYKIDRMTKDENIKKSDLEDIHKHIKYCLEKWHTLTGCTL